MTQKWFQLREQGAGEKRLLLTWVLYKIGGEKVLRFIAFCVSVSIFLTAKERRNASIKFFKHVGKIPIKSAFKQFINYGDSLVDKILSFSGKLKVEDFVIDDEDVFKGTFFLSTHVGNVEILRTMLAHSNAPRANIFMQSNVCEIFNHFLQKMEIETNLEVFPVENIDVETSIETSERLKNGEIVFLAGDRISAQNSKKVYNAKFLGKNAKFPIGALKFALMMECEIAFVVCVKVKDKFLVHTQKFIAKNYDKKSRLEQLEREYIEFLEKYTLKYPEQYYNFYDIWDV